MNLIEEISQPAHCLVLSSCLCLSHLQQNHNVDFDDAAEDDHDDNDDEDNDGNQTSS